MVRSSDERVRLAPADWGGLCSLALAILMLLGATLYKLQEVGQVNRERLTRLESDVTHVQQSIDLLQSDFRSLARGAAL